MEKERKGAREKESEMLRSKYNEGHGRRAKPRPCEEEDFDDDDEMWTKPFRKK